MGVSFNMEFRNKGIHIMTWMYKIGIFRYFFLDLLQ
jgi:hypothetical protein